MCNILSAELILEPPPCIRPIRLTYAFLVFPTRVASLKDCYNAQHFGASAPVNTNSIEANDFSEYCFYFTTTKAIPSDAVP